MATAHEDVIDVLLAQHQQIKLLFAQVESARGEHRQQLFQELVGLLAMHEAVEESLLHPLAQHTIDDAEIVPARLREEQDAKEALSRLYDMGVDDPEFEPRLIALRDAVTAHAEAEEQLEFAQLREAVNEETLYRLAGAMRTVAALSPNRPHPEASTSALGNLLLGPPLAVFDRIRDTLRDKTKAAA